MKVTYSKPKNQRILKSQTFKYNNSFGFHKNKRPLWVEPVGNDWWFDLEKGEWYQGYDSSRRSTTSYYSMSYDGFKNVYSLKAAKRLVAKWNLPKRTKVRVSLPFIGHEFIITA
jgi:hypothetical protein